LAFSRDAARLMTGMEAGDTLVWNLFERKEEP
jgi:hypothetical protein